MKIRQEFQDLDGAKVWEKIVEYVKANGTFSSVEGEYLTGKDFINAYDNIRLLDDINTGKVKPYIKRQQTPFMGLLYSAGIIE